MKRWRSIAIRVAAILVVLVVLAYFGMGYLIYDRLGNVKGSCDEHMANRPDNFALHPTWPPSFDVKPYFMASYQPVRFPSRDASVEVAGWWVEKTPGAPAVILVDGLGGCKNSIAVLAPAGVLSRNGFNVLLIDLRDTGESTLQDGRSTIGNQEYRDVLGAWDWLVQTQGYTPQRIGLFANSLGGATANYAFSEEPRLAALFLQSTFGNLQQVIARELTRGGYPTFLAPAGLIAGSVVTGANLYGHNPLDAIKKANNRPVFIVHTKADTRMSYEQSVQLAEAAQTASANVTTWFPENGEHVQTVAAYPIEFEQRLAGFFRGALGQ